MKFLPLLASILIQTILGEDSNPTDCIKDFDSNKDYFPNKVNADSSSLWSVEYKKSYKILTNKSVNETYVLYQCGSTRPKLDKVKKYVSIPVKNVAAIDTSSVFYLQMLGVFQQIKQVGTADYITSPCVRKGLSDKSIDSVDSNGSFTKDDKTDQFPDSDIIFTSSSVKSEKEIIVSAVSDPGSLKRAEWVEFFSTFFNLEQVGNTASSAINDNFNCIKKNTKAPKNGITVAWSSANAAYKDTPASWSISSAAYKKELTEGASGKILTVDNQSFSDPKEFVKALQKADVIIHESGVATDAEGIAKVYNTTVNDIPAFKNKKLFSIDGLTNGKDGSDWFESAVPFQDAVLQDLVRILGTNVTDLGTNDRLWFRNVATEKPQTLSESDCKYEGKPISSRAAQCKPASADAFKDKDNSGDKNGNSGNSGTTNVASVGLSLSALLVSMLI
jgi:hypothetical protein